MLVAGEDAGGAHGANRLGGNGVAESTVFGARAGDAAAELARSRGFRTPDRAQVKASVDRALAPLARSGCPPHHLLTELKTVMWDGCGLVRSRPEGVATAEVAIDGFLEQAGRIAAPGPAQWNLGWQQALDVVNQLQVAQTMVASALHREESRGAHFREDFPLRRDDRWLRYVVTRLRQGRVEVETRPVAFTRMPPGPPPPPTRP